MSKSVLKGIAVATAVTLGAVSFAASAEAGGRHHYRHHHKHGGGAAVAAAILGFGLAAALSSRPHYYEPSYYSYGYAPYAYAPPPRRYYGPRIYSSYSPPIWSPEWYEYCASKYRSFDPRDGTFQPYHGPRQLCR